MILPEGYDFETLDPIRYRSLSRGETIAVLNSDFVHAVWATAWIGLYDLPHDLVATLVTSDLGTHYLMGRILAHTGRNLTSFPIGVCFAPGVSVSDAMGSVPRILAISSTVFGIPNETEIVVVPISSRGVESFRRGVEELAMDYGWDVSLVTREDRSGSSTREERS